MTLVFAPDPKTLSLVVGIANLGFALLATLYIRETKIDNRALEIWRWGRLIAGSGYLANIASSIAPQWIPPVLGNILQVMAGGCDVAAYSLVLGLTRWHQPLRWLVAGGIGGLVLVSIVSTEQHPRLLLFSLLGTLIYGALSALILCNSRGDWLRKIIGFVDAALALVLLLRIGKGLMFAPLERFDGGTITTVLYLTVYLAVMINGFGFLLLAKQRDDRALARALEDLEAADESRRQLLATASHEFRTPVALIKASLDSLRFVNLSAAPEIATRLDNIRRASQRLTELTDTLLTYDRLQQPDLQNRQPDVDLTALLREALRLYPEEYAIDARLPDGPCHADVDPVHIRIAVQNLIDNALEHTPGAGIPVCVSLNAGADHLDIDVADTGPGIPDAEKARIFERFHNARSDIVRGVGLAIVHSIAVNHGGEALVRDNHPRGTVMTLRLPRGKDVRPAAGKA